MLKNIKLFFPLALAFFSLASAADSERSRRRECDITLDGETTRVFFNDGDTMKVLSGQYKNSRVRIEGFNTLETYGYVHQWLGNSAKKLHSVAKLATKRAQEGSWHCVMQKGVDSYGRRVARCDDLALELLSAGLAHAYSIDKKKALKSYLAKQKDAQNQALGMWANGVPDYIITSLHSVLEGHEKTYDRHISTVDGTSKLVRHEKEYATCQKVCIDHGSSCMIYIPYNERYGRNRAYCKE